MPYYDYKCEDCGHEFELKQSIHDDPVKYCPECNKESVKKLITSNAGGFRITGKGVYKPTSRLGG